MPLLLQMLPETRGLLRQEKHLEKFRADVPSFHDRDSPKHPDKTAQLFEARDGQGEGKAHQQNPEKIRLPTNHHDPQLRRGGNRTAGGQRIQAEGKGGH